MARIYNVKIKISKSQWEKIGNAVGWRQRNVEIDENTKTVGKFFSLEQAKEICIQKNGNLPRVGYEMIIDEGLVELNIANLPGMKSTIGKGKTNHKYETYLQNNEDKFRVLTRIDINPVLEETKTAYSIKRITIAGKQLHIDGKQLVILNLDAFDLEKIK